MVVDGKRTPKTGGVAATRVRIAGRTSAVGGFLPLIAVYQSARNRRSTHTNHKREAGFPERACMEILVRAPWSPKVAGTLPAADPHKSR